LFLKAWKEVPWISNPAIQDFLFGSGPRLPPMLAPADETMVSTWPTLFHPLRLWRGPIEKLLALLFRNGKLSHQVTLCH